MFRLSEQPYSEKGASNTYVYISLPKELQARYFGTHAQKP
ncbi:MAG: hypothetical protein ACJAY7_001689 [Pseudohongiellaceae bacterium]|jgi:hypothetical protein